MKITDEYGNKYTIDAPLSAGGQGAVFKVDENHKLLVKAIINANNKIIKNEKKYNEFEENVLQVIALGDIKNIAKPLCLLEKPNCGYIMRLMENMSAIEAIMLPREMKSELSKHFIITGGLKKRLLVLKSIAGTLNELYKKGIVYSDISPKNIFISNDVDSHEAWLIDVDNMHYETDEASCIGTPSYMAPEVYMGNKNTLKSDVYSFALLAYELLTYSKPFEGKAMLESDEDDWGDEWSDESLSFDEKAARGLLPWVLQANDKTNERIKGYGIPPEAVMTPAMLALFDMTFNSGRNQPSKRPTISQWYHAITEACDSVLEHTLENGEVHTYIGNTCFLCNQKSDYYIAKSYYVSEFDEAEFEEPAYQQEFVCKKGEIKGLSNHLLMDNSDKYTYSILTIQEKKEGSININSKLEELKIALQDAKAKNIENIIINVKQKNKISRRIRFEKEVANGI